MTREAAIATITAAALFDLPITPNQFGEALNTILPIECKECKWWNWEHEECHSPKWDDAEEWFNTPPNMFCGWAERKKDADHKPKETR